ncbi:hypothetical protein [Paenibacillus bovis]|uniref:Uncharacterized protein n=1 Tax=Paenibacillus bovis TaxID=1616788 RepID=A0A1X9T452_9BACL|nr:hypothetical protein [Paenibacillus bovis]ARR10674.1 hypothetical protein AR543_p0066 [Paenibacillus bovis]
MNVLFILWGAITLIVILFLLYSIYKRVTYKPFPADQVQKYLEEILSDEHLSMRIEISHRLYQWEVFCEKKVLNDSMLTRFLILLTVQLGLFIIHPTLSDFFKGHWEIILFILTIIILVYLALRNITNHQYIQMDFCWNSFLLEETLKKEERDQLLKSEQLLPAESRKEVYDE